MITAISWISAVAFLFLLAILISIVGLSQKRHSEEEVLVDQEQPDDDQPDEPYNPIAFLPVKTRTIGKDDPLYKLGEWFQALRYYERYGITFEQYTRMVENGTWRDLATS